MSGRRGRPRDSEASVVMTVVTMPMVMVMIVIMGMTMITVSQALERPRRFGLAVEQGFQRRTHRLVTRR